VKKWLVRIVLLVAFALALSGFPWSGRADQVRWGQRPPQFYEALAGEVHLGAAHLLSVAHNAGDRASTADLALAHGADVLEIDVVAYEGRLYAAHVPPPEWLPARAYRGPTLDDAWARTAGARFVELDLKNSSPAAVRMVANFLANHADGRRVFVVTPSLSALETLRELAPDAIRVLSIADQRGFQSLQDDSARADVINGVSIRATLLDADSAAWLKERGLLIIVWTVNDLEQLNRVAALGIDVVTTDNLAILDALRQAEQRRDALPLGRAFR
jgi:hypothetical protein